MWLINYKVSSKGKTVQDQIVSQWIRHYPWSHLKKVFFCEDKSPANMDQLGQSAYKNADTLRVKDSIVYEIPAMQVLKKQSYKCVLFQHPSPIQLRIVCDDTLKFNQPELSNDDKVVLLTTIQ
jgi:hypothetical protein